MAHERGESLGSIIHHYGGAVLVAVVVALGIRFFGIEAYRIPSQAMRPALEPGDTIFVSKWTYGLRLPGSVAPFTHGRAPARGDVVVFFRPDDPSLDYVKRVVAVAGDTVALKGGQVFLNGKPLVMGTRAGSRMGARSGAVCGVEGVGGVAYEACWEPPILDGVAPLIVPSGQVFVVGDWRSKPVDHPSGQGGFMQSGLVPVTSIKGRALWIWLSIEPPGGEKATLFSRIRFERMFRRIQ